MAIAAGNMVPIAVAPLLADAQQFGAFALAMSAVLVSRGLARSMYADPLLVEKGDRSDGSLMIGSLALSAAATLLGAGLWLAGGGFAAFAFAATSGPLVLLEGLRVLLIKNGRAGSAFGTAIVWVLLVAATSFANLRTARSLLLLALSVNGAAVLAIALVGPARAVVAQTMRGRNLAPTALGRSFSLEYVLGYGLSQAALWYLGLVAGLEAVGSYRLVDLFFAPVLTGAAAVRIIAIRSAAAVDSATLVERWRAIRRVVTIYGFAVLLWSAALYSQLSRLRSWFPSQTLPTVLVLLVIAHRIASVPMLGALSVARAHLASAPFNRAYALFSTTAFAAACIASLPFAARGYVAAYATATYLFAGYFATLCRGNRS